MRRAASSARTIRTSSLRPTWNPHRGRRRSAPVCLASGRPHRRQEDQMSTQERTTRRTGVSSGFVVETSALTKRFGERIAVDNVELRVPRGCAFGYLGPNGAGKTTLIRMLLGLTQATAGQMRLLGRPVPHERAAALSRVGAIVEEPRFHGHLTGRDTSP